MTEPGEVVPPIPDRSSNVTLEEYRKHVPEPFGTPAKCMECGEILPCMTIALWKSQHDPKAAT